MGIKLRRMTAFMIAAALWLTGCSGGREEPASEEEPSSSAESVRSPASSAESVSWDSGGLWDPLCTIYCYGGLFEHIVSEYFPGYAEVSRETSADGTVTEVHATCDGGRVCWYIFPDGGDLYIKALDQALVGSTESISGSGPDIYMVPGSELGKYTTEENGVAMNMDTLGLSSRDRGSMYPFTDIMAENESGEVSAVSWDVPLGLFVYRRSAAKQALGSDDPVQVQAYLGTRDDFISAAEKLKAAGFSIYADAASGYQAYMASSSAHWTNEDSTIRIDPTALSWAQDTEKLYAAGSIRDAATGSVDWKNALFTDRTVFGAFLTQSEITEYFGNEALVTETELSRFWAADSATGGTAGEGTSESAAAGTDVEGTSDSALGGTGGGGTSESAAAGTGGGETSESAVTGTAGEGTSESAAGGTSGGQAADSASAEAAGDWAVCRGPAAYADGGDWFLVSPDTDAKGLARKILRLATCDDDVSKEICRMRGGMVNNTHVMESLGAARSPVFGWQQALGLMDSLADGLEIQPATYTDAGLKAIFRQDFLPFIRGEADQTQCVGQFYTDALNNFPDLLTG